MAGCAPRNPNAWPERLEIREILDCRNLPDAAGFEEAAETLLWLLCRGSYFEPLPLDGPELSDRARGKRPEDERVGNGKGTSVA